MNTLSPVILLTSLTELLPLAGQWLGGTGGMILASIFAVILLGTAYWGSNRPALLMAGAREVTAEEPELHRMVADLACRADVSMPRVYVVHSDAPNAFATGRSPQHGAVVVTTGLRQMLDRDELVGVIAHERGHIKNRDTGIDAVAATAAGAVTMIAQMAQRALICSGLGDDEESNRITSLWSMIILILLAPLAATVIRLAISRAREFRADTTGARIAGNPIALASALRRLETWSARRPRAVDPAPAHRSSVNPVQAKLHARLFRTHPPMGQRIARLEQLALRRS